MSGERREAMLRSSSPTTESTSQASDEPRSVWRGWGRRARADHTWSGPGVGMPLHERNRPDDLFADSDWYSSSRTRRTFLRDAARWFQGGGRWLGRGDSAPPSSRIDMFEFDEPLLQRPRNADSRCQWSCLSAADEEGAQRRPRMDAFCGHILLVFVIVLVVCATCGGRLIQFSVNSSNLSFVLVNITLPSPHAAGSRRRQLGDTVVIGFDSLVRIAAPALSIWPWTIGVCGGNFTLDFSLHPGASGGNGAGDGRFVPCTVGSLYLPPIELKGGRSSMEVPIAGGMMHAEPESECFRGFTRGMLLADQVWVSLRGVSDVQVRRRVESSSCLCIRMVYRQSVASFARGLFSILACCAQDIFASVHACMPFEHWPHALPAACASKAACDCA